MFFNTSYSQFFQIEQDKKFSLISLLIFYFAGLDAMKHKILKSIEYLYKRGIFDKYNIDFTGVEKNKEDILLHRALYGALQCCTWPNEKMLKKYWIYELTVLKKMLELLIINKSTTYIWTQDKNYYPIDKNKGLMMTLHDWGNILGIKGDGFFALSSKFIEKDWQVVMDSMTIGFLKGLSDIQPDEYNKIIKKNLKKLNKNQIDLLINQFINN